ncbi:uncharacterized protein [Halyomorpha halys]|uniref:uncharacterized protein n=1 Tax=Halyomorpha halys TaxID=286706 RepID=UPI0006D4ECB6|nr:uncharacterized protein LOC106684120 [Halyomorpha halys]
MDKELFEVILRKSAADSNIKRIIDMKMESAVPKGENYTSNIFRVTLKVVLGNGRIATKSFILKSVMLATFSKDSKENFQTNSLAKAEASIYINVLREMEYLMEEFGDTEGPFWCDLIHFSQADSTIILEDLKASGFSSVKRTEAQGLEHARLALRSIGRYHAMAKVLEDRGLISKDHTPYTLLYNQKIIKSIVFGGIKALVKGMRATWGEEWSETADKLNQISSEELLKKIQSIGIFDDNTFKCLNHGDFGNNNMMFKHDWEGRPIQLRLIDFQGPHYNTPCVDVIYFIYTSIKPHLRRQNYKSLVELYYESLITSLDRFGYKGSKPSLKEIEDTLKRLSYSALALFIGSFAGGVYKGTDALDVDKIFKTEGEEGFNLRIYSQDGIIEKIGEDIKTFLNFWSD